ncbi:MAG: amino acid permease [Proteobacteria bacterium]|nr:amino acid permease [Pseudomonadota bacterium]
MNATRQLGLWACVALVVGNIVGSGIFLLPASLAPFGMNSVWAWLLTASGSIVLALVFAALSRAFPDAGGPQDYTRAAFGDATAFVVVWAYWVANLVGNVALATAAVSYLSNLLPGLAGAVAAPAATFGLLWVLTGVSLYGARAASRTQMATTAIKLVPLIAVIGLGIWLFATANPQLHNAHLAATPFKLGDMTAAAALTLWALTGVESAAMVACRVRNPDRNVPLASVLGAVFSAGITVIACTTVMALIPAAQLTHSAAPFADAVALFWGGTAGHAVALFAAISCLGALNGWTFLNAEFAAQLARDRLFPAAFTRVSARGAPVVALVVNAVLTSLLLATSYGKSLTAVFNFMILLSTTATLFMYLLCALALLRTLHTGALAGARGRSTGLAVAGALGTIYALWTLYGAGREAVLWGIALMVAGLPLHAFVRMRARQTAVVTAQSS